MSGDTQSRHCWWLMLVVSLAHTRRGVGVTRPHPQGFVATAGDDARAVGAERHAGHRVRVAGQRLADRLAGVRVPQPHGVVVTAGGDPRAVGAERHAGHRVRVAGQRLADGLAGVGVPHPHRLSPLPETMRLPSGLNATLLTQSVWPVSGWPTGWPESRG